MKRLLLLCAAAFLFALTVLGADASGTWTGQMPTRDGEMRDVTFKLKQNGNALTGTMSAFDNDIAVQDGRVEGDRISFSVTLEFGGNSIKILFNGAVKDNQIEFTREREGSGNKQTFTVKHAS